ncbi:hypothetical protein HD554DRAFT_2020603, partial [Boletus coccyginus]
SIRHLDKCRPIQTLLFRAIHNSLRIGRFWIHIKNYEHREKYTHCNALVENLEHILLSCASPERLAVWDVARRTWPTSHPEW